MTDFLKRRQEMIDKARIDNPDLAKQLEQRHTGKSTAMAMGYISHAMLHPEEHVELIDHWGDTFESNKHLAKIVEDIITALGLQGLYLNIKGRKRHYSLVYSLDPKGEVIFNSKMGKKLYR